MNKLSEKEIEAIRKRAEMDTEGSWAYEILCHEQRRYTVGSFKGDLTVIGDIANEEDAEFIVHAREDIPKLLAEIDRLNKIIEECGKDLGSIEGNILGTIGSFTHVSVRLSDIMDVKDKLEEAMTNERK